MQHIVHFKYLSTTKANLRLYKLTRGHYSEWGRILRTALLILNPASCSPADLTKPCLSMYSFCNAFTTATTHKKRVCQLSNGVKCSSFKTDRKNSSEVKWYSYCNTFLSCILAKKCPTRPCFFKTFIYEHLLKELINNKYALLKLMSPIGLKQLY